MDEPAAYSVRRIRPLWLRRIAIVILLPVVLPALAIVLLALDEETWALIRDSWNGA